MEADAGKKLGSRTSRLDPSRPSWWACLHVFLPHQSLRLTHLHITSLSGSEGKRQYHADADHSRCASSRCHVEVIHAGSPLTDLAANSRTITPNSQDLLFEHQLPLTRKPIGTPKKQSAHPSHHATPRHLRPAPTAPHPKRQAHHLRLLRQRGCRQIHHLCQPSRGSLPHLPLSFIPVIETQGGLAGSRHLRTERAEAHGARRHG